MSYDLMVFDTAVAPRDRKRFLQWYEEQTEWTESHNYGDPAVPAQALRRWFKSMIRTFPPMNGPLASDKLDDPKVTDYSLGRSVIYAAFSWSESGAAYRRVKELATKHEVGFFDASGEGGDIWWPVAGWKLVCEAKGEIPLPLNLNFGEVLSGLRATKNSFCILERDSGDYIQCGGGKSACTVEFRRYEDGGSYGHFVVGRAKGSTKPASVRMSQAAVTVQEREVLDATTATELFGLFFAMKEFPKKYVLRQREDL